MLLAFVLLTTMCSRTTQLGIAGGPLHFCSLGAIFILFFVFASLFAPVGLSPNVVQQSVSVSICVYAGDSIQRVLTIIARYGLLWSLWLPQQLPNLVFCNFKVSNSCLLDPTSLHVGKCKLFNSLLFWRYICICWEKWVTEPLPNFVNAKSCEAPTWQESRVS